MTIRQILHACRYGLSHWWIVWLFGGIYLVSQITIGILIEHLGSEAVGKLQVTGFTAEYYLATFAEWDRAGLMPFYKAHFEIDGIHWLWYSIVLTALMALAMNAGKKSEGHNWLLTLPLIAGLCDCLENTVQIIFLSDPEYLTVVDPLPLISTLASIAKWLIVAGVISYIAIVTIRAPFKSASE